MREMIFNAASVSPSTWSSQQAAIALVDIARGMILLIKEMGLNKTLKLHKEMSEITIAADESLYSLLVLLVRQNTHREEARFWLMLSSKSSLLADLPDEVKSRYLSCEFNDADSSDTHSALVETEALVLCAIQAAIAISLPTGRHWENDQLPVSFHEMLPDGAMITATEHIDNLAGELQADAILERHAQSGFLQISPVTFWEHRTHAFPALEFGLDVEKNMADIGGNQFDTIMSCLHDLNTSAAAWQRLQSGSVPPWNRLVTPESASVNQNRNCRKYRYFRDHANTSQYFEWHARFGSNGRIHLRFEAESHMVEIGYIGPHLPL